MIEDCSLVIRPCARGGLRISLLDEHCRRHAAKTRLHCPGEVRVIPAKVRKLESRGIVHPSISTWAAQCFTVRNNDRTARVYQDCCALSALVKTDNCRLRDDQVTFDRLSGSKYLSALDLTSEFSRSPSPQKTFTRRRSTMPQASFGSTTAVGSD